MQQLQLLGKGLLCKTGCAQAQGSRPGVVAGTPWQRTLLRIRGTGPCERGLAERRPCPRRGTASGEAPGPQGPFVPMLSLRLRPSLSTS